MKFKKSFPLAEAYSYLEQNGFVKESNDIRDSTDRYKSYTFTLKRAKIVSFMKENNLLGDFCQSLWPSGLTEKGERRIKFLERLLIRSNNSNNDVIEDGVSVDEELDLPQSIDELESLFKEFLETDKAKNHINNIKKEIVEVNDLMNKLESLSVNDPEFTELVLYALLPYGNTKYAKRISTFPAFLNIKRFFGDLEYSEDDWNNLAILVYRLCKNFKDDHSKLDNYIKEFKESKFSKYLQCGSITPILFSLNQDYPLINNRTIKSFKRIKKLIGEKSKLSVEISDYTENIKILNKLKLSFNSGLLEDNGIFDLLFYWYSITYLSKKKPKTIKIKEKKEPDVEDDEESDVKQIKENLNFKEQLEKIVPGTNFDVSTHSLADPQRIKINSIISNVLNKKWVLPKFQRYFDWTRLDIKDFWESIFENYYVGSFLFWDVDKIPELGVQPILGVQNNSEGTVNPEIIILDGQQRITSLYYAIKSPDFKLRKSRTRFFYYINFNSFFFGKSNNGYIVSFDKKFSRKETFEKMLFPLYELEKYSNWIDEFEDFLHNETQNYEKIKIIRRSLDKKLRHIWEGYEIPYISLPTEMKLNQVTDIFEKINTTGKLLSVFDLLIARLVKYGIELKKLWDETVIKYPQLDRYFHKIPKIPIYILQSMSILYEINNSAKREDILNIYSNVYDDSERNFENDWLEISSFINKAIEKLENLRDGYGVKDENELPFAPMIPVLACLLKTIESKDNKKDCYNKLNIWYWSSIFSNSYSSAADSQMSTDFKEISKWFDDINEIPKVVLQMRRDIETLFFKDIQTQSNAKYRGILSIIALQGARDFDTNQFLENVSKNDKDHIFPKSFDFPSGYKKYINSILNITWMSPGTNRKIKSWKNPSVFIKEFIKDKYQNDKDKFIEVLNSHLINEKALEYLSNDDFGGFIDEREKLFINRIKELIDIKEEENADSFLLTPETPFSNKRAFEETLRGCEGFIYWVDKYFSKVGLQYIFDYINKNNVEAIKILISVDKIDESLKNSFKDFKEELLKNHIICEMRVIDDKKIKSSIHDRWIISRNNVYNIPSPDILARGQFSEIIKTNNTPPFDEWWNSSKDIITNWGEIENMLNI